MASQKIPAKGVQGWAAVTMPSLHSAFIEKIWMLIGASEHCNELYGLQMALIVKDDITFYNLELKQLFSSNSRCAWLISVGLQHSISGNVQSIKNSMKIMEWSEARHDYVWRSNELLVAPAKGEHLWSLLFICIKANENEIQFKRNLQSQGRCNSLTISLIEKNFLLHPFCSSKPIAPRYNHNLKNIWPAISSKKKDE